MINIRPATSADSQQIFDFIVELAVYEKAADEVATDVAAIDASLFAPHSNAHALMCEVDGEAAGMAIYFYSFSTWLGKNGLFLEDLYVAPKHRGLGAGVALMKALARNAIAQDCGRFEWNVLDWNTPAIDFYQSIGAQPQDEWIGYRLSGENLTAFASV